MEHWKLDIIGYWVTGAGYQIEKGLELNPSPPNYYSVPTLVFRGPGSQLTILGTRVSGATFPVCIRKIADVAIQKNKCSFLDCANTNVFRTILNVYNGAFLWK